MSIKTVLIEHRSPVIMPRVVVLNNNEGIEETWKLLGECNKCGVCCAIPGGGQLWPTIYNIREDGACGMLKDVEVDGIKTTKCFEYNARPWCCALYPINPYADKIKECSYTWEKVK